MRVYAGRALAYGEGSPRAKGIQRLRREMRTVEPILAVRAARALWDVSHDLADVRAAYEAGLADSATWHRVETISAIADLGEEAGVFASQLEQLMNDPAPEVRDRAGKIMYVIRARRTR